MEQIIQTNFFTRSPEISNFLFQRGNFLSTKGIGLVSRRLELWEEDDSSCCLAPRPPESSFQSMNPSQNG